jgi:hypothetical protein
MPAPFLWIYMAENQKWPTPFDGHLPLRVLRKYGRITFIVLNKKGFIIDQYDCKLKFPANFKLKCLTPLFHRIGETVKRIHGKFHSWPFANYAVL